jgi:uncharacterized protein (TIGR02217 family)
MSFIDARMPDDISYGLQASAGYKTDVIVLASGHEQRNILWDDARRRYDLAYIRTQAQADTLVQFFHAMKGRAHSFRMRDPSDFSATITTGLLGTGVGTGLPTYQLNKIYTSGSETTTRAITRPVSGEVTVYRAASPVTVGAGAGQIAISYSTGVVTFVADATSNASAITAGATTSVVLAANPGTLIAGEKLYLAGFTGTDAALVNGLAHTINSVSGAGPFTFVLATNTSGKTITLGSGQGRAYPQANDALTWAGNFDVPVRFDVDEITATMLESGPGRRMYSIQSLPVIEVRE